MGDGDYFANLSQSIGVKFIFVDDGSTDNTPQLIDILAKRINGYALHLEKNSGKAEAIRAGTLKALNDFSPNFVGFMDSDGAFSIDSSKAFIEKAVSLLEVEDSFDAVITSRIKLSGRDVHRKSSRHYISRILMTLIGFSVPGLPYDSQSGLKLFRNTKSLGEALSKPFSTKWFFDIELLLRTNWLDEQKVWEEPVLAWRDVDGSHIRWRKYPSLLKEIWVISRLGRANR